MLLPAAGLQTSLVDCKHTMLSHHAPAAAPPWLLHPPQPLCPWRSPTGGTSFVGVTFSGTSPAWTPCWRRCMPSERTALCFASRANGGCDGWLPLWCWAGDGRLDCTALAACPQCCCVALQRRPSLPPHACSVYLSSFRRHGRVALVGHSAGGWVARLLLGREPYQGGCAR